MEKVRFQFSKKGLLSYISHLDLMRLFMRAARRANFTLSLSQGFSPHPRLSIKKAQKLGKELQAEEAYLILEEGLEFKEFKRRFEDQLPLEIRIEKIPEVKDEQRNPD